MISSPHLLSDMSSGLSHLFITWQLSKLNQCSKSRKENWLVIITIIIIIIIIYSYS